MKQNELYDAWQAEEKAPFVGWDFSYLANRWQEEPLPWGYKAIVQKYLQSESMLLDMGTGGGEFLFSLNHPDAKTAVTEAWPPNIKVCQQKLTPIGITVYPVEDNKTLPIDDDSFDVVINRQADYEPKEIWRVLKPGGIFITQQVGSENCVDLAKAINADYLLPDAFGLQTEVAKFEDTEFTIRLAEEAFPALYFYDVGAFVYWARQISWTFPGFSVENNFAQLCAMQQGVEEQGYIAGKQHRFLIVAQK